MSSGTSELIRPAEADGTILTHAHISSVELQVHLGMLSEEIMSIDKQIGRIYNHIDRMTSN